MTIFKDFSSGGRDRSAEDRRRHRELVEESIKKNIGSIIAEESIIGVSKGKKVKVPIKSIKEYQFIYGKNGPGVGTGDGSEQRGDKIGEEKEEQQGKGQSQAGKEEGEDIYETEITIEELIQYLFEDLSLPDIDRKKLSRLEALTVHKSLGFQKKGIPPRLAKRRSVIEKIKRNQGSRRNEMESDSEDETEEEERFPFIEEDLRYHRKRLDHKRDYNAVVICIMDVSGSMDQTKKYMARSFYFLLYQFLLLKYSNVEVVFVAHTTTAKEVNEMEFFHKGESGGTYISSGYEKALEIIEQRYSPANWNIYAFHCSDGDNWSEDNKKAVESANRLCDVCNLFGYGEILSSYYSSYSTIKAEFERHVNRKNFCIVTMMNKEDIVPAMKKLLGG